MAKTMSETVKVLRAHETPNGVCAICRKNGAMVSATHEVLRGPFVRYFVCGFHAKRKLTWARITRRGRMIRAALAKAEGK